MGRQSEGRKSIGRGVRDGKVGEEKIGKGKYRKESERRRRRGGRSREREGEVERSMEKYY